MSKEDGRPDGLYNRLSLSIPSRFELDNEKVIAVSVRASVFSVHIT